MEIPAHYVPGHGWRYSIIVDGMQVTEAFWPTKEKAQEAGRKEIIQLKEERRHKKGGTHHGYD